MAADRKIGKYTVHVVTPDEVGEMIITPEDQDMDRRVKAAVDSAIKRVKVCKKPIALFSDYAIEENDELYSEIEF